MDLLLTQKLLFKKRDNEEGFVETETTTASVVVSVVSMVVFLYAVYLSWTCNTAKGYGTVRKVIYAIFAGFFGWLYLLIYFIFWRPGCAVAKSRI